VWLGDYQDVSDKQLIGSALVDRARKANPKAHRGDEFIMGVDVARFGDDETVIAFRRGRDACREPWIALRKLDTMEVAARVASHWQRLRPDALFVDETGVGAGVVDRLKQLGVPVIPVNFGARSDDLTEAKTANKRAEMWVRMREWLRGESAIPDDDRLAAELTAVEYKHDANNAIQLERKEDMRKRGLPSPDRADALALTFAFPVRAHQMDEDTDDRRRTVNKTTGY
jgi:hypothetical protein